MPLTPFHIGPAIFFGMLFSRYLNFPALIVSSVIVDIEPFLVIVLGLDYPMHGFFHSLLGGSILALTVSLSVMRFKGSADKMMDFLRMKQEMSSRSVFIAAFSGVYLHIFLDSFLYTDIKPFFPLDANPFYGLVAYGDVILFCVSSFFGGILMYAYKLKRTVKI